MPPMSCPTSVTPVSPMTDRNWSTTPAIWRFEPSVAAPADSPTHGRSMAMARTDPAASVMIWAQVRDGSGQPCRNTNGGAPGSWACRRASAG